MRRKSTNYEGQRSCIIVPAPPVGNQSYETVYKHLTALVASLSIPEVTSQRPLGSNRCIRQSSCSAHKIILQLISLYDITKDHGKASKTMGGRCKGMDKAEMKLIMNCFILRSCLTGGAQIMFSGKMRPKITTHIVLVRAATSNYQIHSSTVYRVTCSIMWLS